MVLSGSILTEVARTTGIKARHQLMRVNFCHTNVNSIDPALIHSNTVTANFATDYDIKCNTAGEYY